MSNEQIIVSVENFKFRIFDSVPKPQSDMAYVLYQENAKEEKLLVITPESPALSSQIKSGGFDRIMTISTAVRQFEIAKRIADATGMYKFNIAITLFYRIKNIEYVFKQDCWDIDKLIENYVFQIIKSKHGKFDIDCEIELESELIEMLPLLLTKQMDFLDIVDHEIIVEVDERARKVLDVSLDTMADSIIFEKEKEKELGEIEGKKQIEIQKMKAQKEVEHERNDVIMEKANLMDGLMKKLGQDLAVSFLAYEKGEISGVELDDRIRNNRNSDMLSQLTALKNLVDLQVISGPVLEQAAMKLIGQSDIGVVDANRSSEYQDDTNETDLDSDDQDDSYTDPEEY